MKLKCRRTKRRYGEKMKWHRWVAWYRWFAWYPVSVGSNDYRWLEFVERKGKHFSGVEFDPSRTFEYRLLSKN